MNKLPKISDCIQYIESLGFKLTGRGRSYYCFRDTTGNRPPHNQEMIWTLGELRWAKRHGC